MIGWMQGVLRAKRPPLLLVDVHGVGYELEAPMTTFYDLPEMGATVTLFIHQVVRDDALHLYAFSAQAERDVFRLLLKVSGVGAKLGLAILSGMDAAGFSRCVFAGDTARLSGLPGIGKKTAERLVMEMRDRLQAPMPEVSGGAPGDARAARAEAPSDEAVHALVTLGLKLPEASRRVSAVDCTGLACEDIVRLALQSMAR